MLILNIIHSNEGEWHLRNFFFINKIIKTHSALYFLQLKVTFENMKMQFNNLLVIQMLIPQITGLIGMD